MVLCQAQMNQDTIFPLITTIHVLQRSRERGRHQTKPNRFMSWWWFGLILLEPRLSARLSQFYYCYSNSGVTTFTAVIPPPHKRPICAWRGPPHHNDVVRFFRFMPNKLFSWYAVNFMGWYVNVS